MNGQSDTFTTKTVNDEITVSLTRWQWKLVEDAVAKEVELIDRKQRTNSDPSQTAMLALVHDGISDALMHISDGLM